VNIYLDGNYSFSLARILVAWLKVGQELGEEKIASLRSEDEHELVYQKALHFINFRPRSTAEIIQNLSKRGISEPLAQETVERLKNTGLVNDDTFARDWVENRNAFRPRSRSFLKIELKQKGLSEETINSVLAEQVDEQTLAIEAARKYARRLAGLDWPKFRQKLGGFLARRGFSYTIAAPAVSEVWKETQTADPGSISDYEE